MKGKQNPVEKEWAAVVKAEERFLRHAMPARTAGWQEKMFPPLQDCRYSN